MIIKEKLGTLSVYQDGVKTIDWVHLEWYETGKRILHKTTTGGVELTLRFLKETQNLAQDDVLYTDAERLIAINIIPCPAIVIKPSSLYEMAFVCYEIGNKHLPLFFENDAVLIPFEEPFFKTLQASGIPLTKENKKLLHPIRTTVTPHSTGKGETLFSKILQLTTAPSNA